MNLQNEKRRYLAFTARALLAAAACAAPLAACTTNTIIVHKTASADGGDPDAAPAAAPGQMGGACNPDGTCGAGLTCLPPALVGGNPEKYCAPTCNTNDDCNAFAATSYQIGVPDTVTPLGGNPTPNVWRSKLLARGFVCAAQPSAPNGQKYCMFACGNYMALGQDASGKPTECHCLPGYSVNATKDGCTYGTTHQCSIFTYGTDAQRQGLLAQYGIQTQAVTCDACNSDESFTNTVGCHTGMFFCNLTTTSMNGQCAEGMTTDQFNQCLAQKTNFDCNCACTDGCTDPSSCYGCCTCSPTSAPVPKPVCTPDAG